MNTERIAEILALQHEQFVNLADTWLAMGASAVGIWNGGKFVAHHPDGVPLPLENPDSPETQASVPMLAAPLDDGHVNLGELRIYGVHAPWAQRRIQADAQLLAHLLNLEGELEHMTAEFVENQDQMLALYELTRSTRSQLNIEDTLLAVAREIRRLTNAQHTFVLLAAPEHSDIVWASEPLLDTHVLYAVFRPVRDNGIELHLLPGNDLLVLPSTIFSMFLEPVRIRGDIVAGLGLFKSATDFSSPDIKLIRVIAEQVGAQLENVLLYRETLAQARLHTEMELAKQVQGHLLPRTAPRLEELDIYAETRSALQVGGDFYDFILSPKRPLVFTVGDVAGKGYSAAMLMAMTRTSVRSKAAFMPNVTPRIIVERSIEDLYEDFTKLGMFATVFIGQYLSDQKSLIYTNAGHSPVIYCRRNQPALMLDATCPAMGFLPQSFAMDERLAFGPGDVLLIATDGFSEARASTGEMFGFDRLVELSAELAERCTSAEEISQELFKAIEDFAAGHAQDDDQTLVVIRGQEPAQSG